MSENHHQKKFFGKPLHIAAITAAVILLTVGRITAYLIDMDVRRNVIIIGSIKTVLDEGTYEDEQTVVPGQIVFKAPKLTNTGKNNAYVFLRIEVPKANVTLLYEEDITDSDNKQHKAGEIKKEKSNQQIFKLIADGENTDSVKIPADNDVIISYHAKSISENNPQNGWVLLENECNFSGNDKDVYVFAYSQKLHPNDKTRTLFDKVQLKSIIDHQLHDSTDLLTDTTIKVQGYAIQDRNLHVDSLEDDTEQPTPDQLKKIYEIVQRKAAQNNE